MFRAAATTTKQSSRNASPDCVVYWPVPVFVVEQTSKRLIQSVPACSHRLPDGASRRSNLGPQIGSLLRHRSSDTGSLHLSLGVHDHTSVIYELTTPPTKTHPRSTGTFRSFFSRPCADAPQQRAWLDTSNTTKAKYPSYGARAFPSWQRQWTCLRQLADYAENTKNLQAAGSLLRRAPIP